MKRISTSICSLLLLAACGGGSTGGSNAPAFTSTQGAVDELEFFLDEVEQLGPTPAEVIPTSGSARYEGVFSLAQTVSLFPGDPNPSLRNPMIGELGLNVDFADNTVSGNADNFFGGEGAVAGALTISDGEVLRTDVGVLFDGDVSGQLGFGSVQRDVDGAIFGFFIGENAEFPSGSFEGTADGFLPLSGAFFAD